MFHRTDATETKPNFIASEVGLVSRTCTVSQSLGVENGDKKIVPAGTIVPSNDAQAKGILVNDIDVTYGDNVGAMYVAGRFIKDYLPTAPDTTAETPLTASGIIFETAEEE